MKLLSIFISRTIVLAICIALNVGAAVWFDVSQSWLVGANIASLIVTGIFTYADVRRVERGQS